jgi:hypothetical protein
MRIGIAMVLEVAHNVEILAPVRAARRRLCQRNPSLSPVLPVAAATYMTRDAR